MDTLQPLYGVDVKVLEDRKWYHASEGDRPLFFTDVKEAKKRIQLLNDNLKSGTVSTQENNKLIVQLKNAFAQKQGFASWDEMLDESSGSIYEGMLDGVLDLSFNFYRNYFKSQQLKTTP